MVKQFNVSLVFGEEKGIEVEYCGVSVSMYFIVEDLNDIFFGGWVVVQDLDC